MLNKNKPNYLSWKDLSLPKRKQDAKKGDNGRVLVIGGSEEYVGAVALAGLAALRSGVDWVTIAAPEKVGWAINCLSPDLVVKKFKGGHFSTSQYTSLLKLEEDFDVVLIGPGITKKPKEFVKKYVIHSKKPLVVDADALKVISLTDINNAILTPHKKEFDMIIKNSGIKSGEDLKKTIRDNVIILKGKEDKIITENEIFYNKTGNEGMTKAGTGDVLAGLAAGFYAQAKNITMAAKLATFYNGLVGDLLLKKKKGFTYLASDMIEEIHHIMNKTKKFNLPKVEIKLT